MNPDEAIRDTENSIRNLIIYLFKNKYGSDWTSNLDKEVVNKWKSKQEAEKRQLKGDSLSRNLIYYADLYQLKDIVSNFWSIFSAEFLFIFDSKKKFEFIFEEFAKFRNPQYHHRTLLPYQKNLVLGLSGYIRANIVKFMSREETGESYYPQIESVVDNFGQDEDFVFNNRLIVHPGDELVFTITAYDYHERKIFYAIHTTNTIWTEENILRYKITEEDIQERFEIMILIKGDQKYHANQNGYDDLAVFRYRVRPNEEF